MLRLVAGRQCLAPSHNHSHNSINVIEHVACGNAQHGKAGPLQIRLAQRIDTCPIPEFVSATVELNQQARRKTCEVSDITADRVLATKFQAFRSRAKSPPQYDLR
jgi:hypothetical protein